MTKADFCQKSIPAQLMNKLLPDVFNPLKANPKVKFTYEFLNYVFARVGKDIENFARYAIG